jgi:hypothetical protein
VLIELSDTDLNRGYSSSQTETIAAPSFPNPKSKIQNLKWYDFAASHRRINGGLVEKVGSKQTRKGF